MKKKVFLTSHTTDPTEVSLYLGNRERVPVKAIGTYHLFLDIGYHLDLLNYFFVPTISRNLISISKLDLDGFHCKFGQTTFSLFKSSSFIGSGLMIDGLYHLKLDDDFANFVLNTAS